MEAANYLLDLLKQGIEHWNQWRSQHAQVQLNFRWVTFGAVDLSDGNLSYGDFTRANLQRAQLCRANLQQANLSGTNLRGACLAQANLQGANLKWANLARADLRGANLSQANLTGADLSAADLTAADLQGAILQEAKLTQTKLPQVTSEAEVTLQSTNSLIENHPDPASAPAVSGSLLQSAPPAYLELESMLQSNGHYTSETSLN